MSNYDEKAKLREALEIGFPKSMFAALAARVTAAPQEGVSVPPGYALVPIEPDGAMWSASRREFIKFAQQYEDAPTAERASIVGDIAGPDIYRAMVAAALPPGRGMVPMTEIEIASLRHAHGITSDGRGIKEFTKVVSFVRAIEASAHGIKEGS